MTAHRSSCQPCASHHRGGTIQIRPGGATRSGPRRRSGRDVELGRLPIRRLVRRTAGLPPAESACGQESSESDSRPNPCLAANAVARTSSLQSSCLPRCYAAGPELTTAISPSMPWRAPPEAVRQHTLSRYLESSRPTPAVRLSQGPLPSPLTH